MRPGAQWRSALHRDLKTVRHRPSGVDPRRIALLRAARRRHVAARHRYALHMPDQPAFDIDTAATIEEDRQRLAWEVPEVAAIVLLAAFGALVLGGLIAGIVASTDIPIATGQFIGAVITEVTQWADPLVAIALLGVIGISWWQRQAWTDALEAEPHLSSDAEALGHLDRARRIDLYAQSALLLTVAGAAASLVGIIIVLGNNAAAWSRYVYSGASLIVVTIIAGGGLWISRKATAGSF